jgi:hypothetical protein
MPLRPNRISTRTAAAVAALVLAGGGGAAAVAATSSGGARKTVMDDAAARLGVKPAALQGALEAAAADRVDAAVKAGRISAARGAAIKARIKDGRGPLLGGGRRRGLTGGARFRSALRTTAADYLGLTPAELRGERRSGMSLAEIASARGKSVDGLETALVDAVRARLDKAVKGGRMSAAQEQQRLDALRARIAVRVRSAGRGPVAVGARTP